jgi:uncharacterized membrane protein HdeD (DUF308 family)
MGSRGWTALMGLLSIAAGLILLAYPGLSLLTLAILLSIWLLVLGLMEITLAPASGPPDARRVTARPRPAGRSGG